MTTPQWMAEPDFSAGNMALVASLGALIVMTVVGNLLVIAAVATTRRLRTVTNYFIVSLAVSDLLVGLLVMPIAVVQQVTGVWILGRVVCELWVSMDVLLCTASILNLCCISLDRYFAITSPLTYVLKRSGRLALLMITAAWILSAIITCPTTFGWHESDRSSSDDCNYNRDQGYVVYSALGSFYIPAAIMIYVYWRIFVAAHKRQTVLINDKKGADFQMMTADGSSGSLYEHTDVPQQPRVKLTDSTTPDSTRRPRWSSDETRDVCCEWDGNEKPRDRSEVCRVSSQRPMLEDDWEKRTSSDRCIRKLTKHRTSPLHRKEGYERAAFQRERRVAKSLAIVVSGFIVCWLPFFITYIMEPFCTSCSFPPLLDLCLVWLGWLNSTINPFIYALNNKDFKKAFLRLTVDKCCAKRKVRQRHDPRNFT